MRMLISLALLFSFAFSTVHEYVFVVYDNDHCDAMEYVHELNAPSEHGDICDIHFEYHQAYILTPSVILTAYNFIDTKPDFYKDTYNYHSKVKFTKPPIS